MSLDLGRFDALTFDCYGTLIDWERGMLSALAYWRARTLATARDEELLRHFGSFETVVQQEHPDWSYPRVLREVLARIAARIGVDVLEEEAAAFGDSVGDWPPFEDSGDALRALGRRYKLIAVSNVDRPSFEKSERRLGVRFDALVCAGEVGAYKPDPRMFEAALECARGFGVEKDRVLHVAQSLYHDHVPARKLGLKTVWVDRRGHRPGPGAVPEISADEVAPDLRVSALDELRELAERAAK